MTFDELLAAVFLILVAAVALVEAGKWLAIRAGALWVSWRFRRY